MRPFALLASLLLAVPLAAQPPPDGPVQPSRGTRAHLFVELAGAGPLVSINTEHPVGRALYVRGGLGVIPGVWGPTKPTFVVGVGTVRALGDFLPEAALSATFAPLTGWEFLAGPYLGLRFATRDGSVVRLGGHVFLVHEEGASWTVVPWPALSFGGRL